MDVGPLGGDPGPLFEKIIRGQGDEERSYVAREPVQVVPGFGRVWLHARPEAIAALKEQTGLIAGSLARGRLARQDPWCSHCHEPGHEISRCPQVGWLGLAAARRRFLAGDLDPAGFIAAVDRAGWAELEELPPAVPHRLPWWKRLAARVLSRLAGPRRVV